MRDILIDLSTNNYPKSILCGFDGEHNQTQLVVILPEDLVSSSVSYSYKFAFGTPYGEKILYPSTALLSGNKVKCVLAQDVTVADCVAMQVEAYQNSNNQVNLIAKTPVVTLLIGKSVGGGLIDHTNINFEASIYEQIMESISALQEGKQDKTDNALQTESKTVVGAINELNNNKQDKVDNALQTTDKTVVGAINEVKSRADSNFSVICGHTSALENLSNGKQDKEDNRLQTESKSVVGAINEIVGDVNTVKQYINEPPDTFYANESDYAVCFEWADGNPAKENRLNRFVQLTDGGNKISFANSTADICGVTTDTAGFVENYGVHSEYTSFVGILGIVTVIDNGTCTVGECCMSDDNGYAVPSSNNMGYRVMARVDANKIKVAVKPNDDMIQRIRTDISDIKAYLGYTDKDIYGVEVDFKNKNFTRLAGAVGKVPGESFDSVKAFGGRKRCNVTDDGKVVAYYGETGYSETGVLTQPIVKGEGDTARTYPEGTMVQVMVEQPKFYYKVVPLEIEKIQGGKGFHMRKARYYVSDTMKSGFKIHPAFVKDGKEKNFIYLSAYEGCTYDTSTSAYNLNDAQDVDWTNDVLASIANAKPTSGLTQIGATRNGFRTIAAKRGAGWSLQTVQSCAASQILFLVEYASFNIQACLRNGVTNKPDDGSTNMSEITGATTVLGNKSGSVVNTNDWNVVSYRGEENPFGNIWKWIDGVNINNGSEFAAGDTGTIYVADHDFADNKGDGSYHEVGFSSVYSRWSYISAFGYAETDDWMFIPTEGLGNSSLPVGDCISCANTGWLFVRVSGCWRVGLSAGLFAWNADGNSSYRARNIGGRLLYVPDDTDGPVA